MSTSTTLENRVHTKVKKFALMVDKSEEPKLSTPCSRGPVRNGCSHCFKKDCPCACHKRVGR